MCPSQKCPFLKSRHLWPFYPKTVCFINFHKVSMGLNSHDADCHPKPMPRFLVCPAVFKYSTIITLAIGSCLAKWSKASDSLVWEFMSSSGADNLDSSFHPVKLSERELTCSGVTTTELWAIKCAGLRWGHVLAMQLEAKITTRNSLQLVWEP